jgi:hypothetical protein
VILKMEPNFYERYYICRNVDEFYKNFNVTAKYSVPFSTNELALAIRNVILQTPALVHNFFRDGTEKSDRKKAGKNFIKRPVAKISVDDILVVLPDEVPIGDEYFKRLNNVKFAMDVEKPLWNLYVAYYQGNQYLSYITDHSLVDGTCGVSFHQDLLRELVQIQGVKSDPLEVIFNSDTDILPPLPPTTDKIAPILQPSIWYAAKLVFIEFIMPEYVLNFIRKWTDPESTDTSKNPLFTYKPTFRNVPTFYKLINLTPDEVKSMLSFTKSRKVTFSSYISAIGSHVMQDVIFPRISAKDFSSSVEIAINGRRYYPGEKALRYAFFVSIVEPTIGPFPKKASVSSVEKAMNRIDKSINDALGDASLFSLLGMLRYVNPWDYLHGKLGKNSRSTISLSNLGNAIVREKDIEVDDLIFSQDLGLTSHIGLTSVGTPRGGFNILINYFDYIEELVNPDTKQKAIDEFSREFHRRLVEYARENTEEI